MKHLLLLLCLVQFSHADPIEKKLSLPESSLQNSKLNKEKFIELTLEEKLKIQTKTLADFGFEKSPVYWEAFEDDYSLQMELLGRSQLKVDFETRLGSKSLLRVKTKDGESLIVGTDDTAPVNAAILPKLIKEAFPNLSDKQRKKLDSNIQSYSKSVCLITSEDNLFMNQPITARYGDIHELNEDQPLVNMPSIINGGECRCATGFLIGKKSILTARHVIKNKNVEEIKRLRVIFNYKLSSHNPKRAQRVNSHDVYKVRQVIDRGEGSILLDKRNDWCVLELVKVVNSGKKLRISKSKLKVGQELVMIGHPDGMPLTGALKGKILKEPSPSTKHAYYCSLDSFHGNSGSPIFTYPKFELVGLYVAGKPIDRDNGKLKSSPENSNKIKQSFISIRHLKNLVNSP